MACEFVAQPKTFSSIHFYQYTLLTDEWFGHGHYERLRLQ